MSRAVPTDPSLLIKLRDFLTLAMGLYYPEERLSELERCFSGAAVEFGFEFNSKCIEWILSGPLTDNRVRVIAKHLTVGETYFFRDEPLFRYLQEELLPLLIYKNHKRNSLRIWSAGCCSGEEPYSVSMLLSGLLPRSQWQLDILATDINVNYLAKAFAAVYGQWSMRETNDLRKEKYFIKCAEKQWAVKSDFKKDVRFSYLNLADDLNHYPSIVEAPMDLIFCRNVLIYFSEAQAKNTVQKLRSCLASDGYLVLAPSEVSLASHGFNVIQAPGVILLQREDGAKTFLFGGIKTANWLSSSLHQHQSDDPFAAFFSTPEQPSLPSLASGPEVAGDLEVGRHVEPAYRSESKMPTSKAPARTLLQQAESLYSSRHYLEVIEFLQSCPDTEANAASATILARALANVGNMTAALEWIERSLKLEKLSAVNHYLRGSFLLQLDRSADAAKAFQNALFLDQSLIMAEFALANLQVQEQQPKKAALHYNNCLVLMKDADDDLVIPESDGMIVRNMRSTIVQLLDQWQKTATRIKPLAAKF